MSSYKYKKTNGEDDGDPLTLNETGIELNTFSAVEEPASVPQETVEEDREEVDNKVFNKLKPCRVKTCYMIWALITTGLLFGLILVALLAHGSLRSIRWCCLSKAEFDKCSVMAAYFDVETLRPKLLCQLRKTPEECVNAIDTDKIDVMMMSPHQLYQYKDKLMPIMAEEVLARGSKSEAVFGEYFVRAKLVNSTFPKPCKTSYCTDRETANRSPGVIERATEHTLKKSGRCPLNITIVDDIQGSSSECPVMFTTVNKLKHLVKTTNLNESDIQVICLNGSHTTLARYKECTRLFVPTSAMVISNKLREGSDADVPFLIVELFHVSYLYFGRDAERFQMFNSSEFNAIPNLIFNDRTLKLVPLLPKCAAQTYLGNTYMEFREGHQYTKNNATCFLNEFKRPVLSEIN